MERSRIFGTLRVAWVIALIGVIFWLPFQTPSPITGLVILLFGATVTCAGIWELYKRQRIGALFLAYGLGQVALGLADCGLTRQTVEIDLRFVGELLTSATGSVMFIFFAIPFFFREKYSPFRFPWQTK